MEKKIDMNKIKEEASFINDEIERKLFCIKSCLYECNKEFEDTFKFNFKIFSELDNNEDRVVQLNNKIYNIKKQSRLITFIISKVSYIRFIYSHEYLKSVMDNYKIQQYYSGKNENSYNSSESEVSDGEIYNIFEQKEILIISKIETKYDRIIDTFKHRYNLSANRIENSSLNAKIYYPKNYEDELNRNIFGDNTKQMEKHIWNSSIHIIYFMGPKGSSKSLFLLNFCFFQNINNNPTLYINYKKLKETTIKSRNKIFKKEMVYLFFEENGLKDFYHNGFYKIIKNEQNEFLHNLIEFIKAIINVHKNYFSRKIIMVIDNFDEDNEELSAEMEQLINLINTNPSKIKLIISGNSDFLIKKFVLFLNKKNFDYIIDNQLLFIYDLKLNSNNEIKALAAFNFLKNINDNNLEDILLNDEMKYCKKFNLYGMHYSVINNGKKLKLDDLLKYIHILPFEYITFSINNDNSITFEYFNPIFLKAVKKYIKSEIKEKTLDFLLKNDNKDRIINGIYEEKLLCTLISYNKLSLNNMNTPEDNLLEVSKICDFKEKQFSKTNNKINIKFPIIITQEIFLSELYDLLILTVNNKEPNTYFAYMTQIGTNKTKYQIETIKKDFDENKGKYIKGIKKFIDNNINIEKIELLFIFDLDTQKTLDLKDAKIYESGSKFCANNKIHFYCFSIEDYKLYKIVNGKKYFSVISFGDFDINIKRNWSEYLRSRLWFLSDNEIKFINSKISGDIKDMSLIDYRENVEFSSIKNDIDGNKIYVLFGGMNKYLIVKNIIYKVIEDKYEEIETKKINNKEIFNVNIVSPSDNFQIKFLKSRSYK